ncbi:hypothetical protein O0G45_09720 [Staphylococcus pseudintermedius]|uniref:hypothetical protein n=1 Tax=Staphylococcus pseudintermedius TaxID=283734 RepID=UPI000AC9CDFE|nr:hypothetical protein [Staphylococcus pseudintermedius]
MAKATGASNPSSIEIVTTKSTKSKYQSLRYNTLTQEVILAKSFYTIVYMKAPDLITFFW